MSEIPPSLADALSDRYRLEHELGRGGMAVVYLARDLKHQRLVALKVFRPDAAGAMGADRFHREIRVTAGLQHAADHYWCSMPYVLAPSARHALRESG